MAGKKRTSKSSNYSKSKKRKGYALISVSDKSGIADFARTIDSLGYRIISTGGTARTLAEAGIGVTPIQDITGNPESFDGRMKTISFQVEGGILYDRNNPEHVRQAEELEVPRIDIVVANLYPFEKTVADPNTTVDEAVEQIDVGGPTMVRSAAKNHKNVLIVTDPRDYETVAEELKSGTISEERRKELAAKAFEHLSFYDSQIASYLSEDDLPEEVTLPGRKVMDLRYGENPHQQGALYTEPGSNSPIRNLRKLTGSEPSLTNITDIAAGLELIRMLGEDAAAAVIKHNTPCGVALGTDGTQALSRAIEADPVSAFGGVVVLNRPIDMKVARIIERFKEEHGQFDIIAAPSATNKAMELITSVRKRTGIYDFGEIPDGRRNGVQAKTFDGGFVLQDWDEDPERSFPDWKVATEKKPTRAQLRQMKFAWKIIGRIKSNTIMVVDRDLPMTRGIGSGQTSRVGSTEIALIQAGEYVKGGILASDSFFPFDDSVRLAADAGIGAIVQQGGSINDKASIDAANKAGISMVLTGERKFWH